ncbi:MAG: protein-L-isoaspartate(D-aspartate) O-methyltransferase [Nanoarchaeota archaeon]
MTLIHMLEDLEIKGITDKKVLEAIKNIPRHLFVPEELKNLAYEDQALPILSQSISQPYTVAFMLQNLNLKEKDKVLEIGSGSGWNSALIQNITKTKVFSVEFDKELAKFAKSNLKKAEIKNVKIIIADGNKGYKKESPYNKIIVTAACSKIPYDLIKQLKNNGILIAPIGSLYEQSMIKITKLKNEIKKENLGQFVFVPLKGKYGF